MRTRSSGVVICCAATMHSAKLANVAGLIEAASISSSFSWKLIGIFAGDCRIYHG